MSQDTLVEARRRIGNLADGGAGAREIAKRLRPGPARTSRSRLGPVAKIFERLAPLLNKLDRPRPVETRQIEIADAAPRLLSRLRERTHGRD